MKITFHSIKAWLVSGLLMAGYVGNAQQYQFGQNVDYPFGYKPNTVVSDPTTAQAKAEAAYTSWKAGFLTAGPTCAGTGTLRVKFDAVSGRFGITGDNSIVSVSEGIAYGMLLSSYHGDQATFDGLWAYYKKFMNSNGIMNWGINNANNCAIVGQNGATDAELDAAWALFVAHNQWGNGTTSTYLTDCKTLIGAIKANEVDKAGNLNTLKPGDKFGGHQAGNDLVNPSYFSPAYYRTFGDITNDADFWNSVYNRGYDILEKAENASTGLVPDWCTSTGTTPASLASTYTDGGVNFFYDAIRTPVRTALDYLWYGDAAPRALAYTKKVNSWVRTANPSPVTIGAKYSLSGTKLDNSHNNTFVGAFAVSSMATDDINTRSYITSLYTEDVNVNPGTGEYFNSSWKALSLFMLTGNFYLPPPDLCDGPYLDPAYQLCNGTGTPKSLTLDAGAVTGATYQWKVSGTTTILSTSQKYQVTQPGLYEVSTSVTVGTRQCVRRAGTVVYPATPTASFTFTRNGTAVDFTNTSTGGDLLATPPSLTASWNFGTGATPATSTTVNGATNYSTSGLKLVTLTVTNGCGQTSSYTEQVPLPTAAGPGWYATEFTDQNQGLFSAYTATNTPNPNVTFDLSNCQYGIASVNKAMGQYETVAVTFKNSSADAPLDVTAYPYARFRIKIVATNPATLLPNGLRVDLVDNTYKASGSVQANLVYLQGPRNADGTYQPIPVNQWFISTLSFEGKLSAIDAKNVLQLAFTPYNDLAANSTARQNYQILVDWVTVGNKDIPKPAPSIGSGNLYVCETSPVFNITGSSLDSCNSEYALWNDGLSSFSRSLSPGSYSVRVHNFGGDTVINFSVVSTPLAQAALSYTVLAASPFQIQPYDNSIGHITQWKWHRSLTLTGTLSGVYNSNAGNTFLYSSSITNPNQTPPPSPTSGRPSSAIFTGNGAEYLCLVITPAVSNCVTSNRACVLVNPNPLAIEDYLNEQTFKVYPTLVDNKLYVEIGGNLQGTFDVQISNIYGSQMLSTKVSTGTNTINLDNSLATGTYLVNVNRDGKSIVKKFIKQ